MTLKQSLEICIQQWDWLAANPDKDKQDWAKDNPNVLTTFTLCACCQYTTELRGEIGGTSCESCPLAQFWLKHTVTTKEYIDNVKGGYCEYSIYEKWNDTKYDLACADTIEAEEHHKTRVSPFAKMIADAAREELAKL